MDSITNLIKTEIKKQYKSVRQFSEKSGIPYSTLSNCLSKGIGGTSYDTVIKICNLLNLKQIYDADLTMFNDQFCDICHMLSELDERGVHTVEGFEKVKHSKFELYQDKSGSYRFRLKATNGEIIAVSESYTTLASCKNGVESVKKNAPDAEAVEEA